MKASIIFDLNKPEELLLFKRLINEKENICNTGSPTEKTYTHSKRLINLNLPNRVSLCLERNQIITIEQLRHIYKYTPDRLRGIKGIGQKSLELIRFLLIENPITI